MTYNYLTNKIIIYLLNIILIFFTNFVFAEDKKMQKISYFSIDLTEVSIAEFSKFTKTTNYITEAEKRGWGYVYEFGWVKKEGWDWKKPYGIKAELEEPAVHINFDEAQMFCKWKNKRLPTEEEWVYAAYTETREKSLSNLIYNKTYEYPVGNTPTGANCLGDCNFNNYVNYKKLLSRGNGHSKIGFTKKGINGLYDMGANVWEWANIDNNGIKATKGGSWWYGKEQMHLKHQARKDKKMSAVYIGFRCVKNLN